MISGLYFITDQGLSKNGVFEDVKQVLNGGCRLVQYREKEKSAQEIITEAQAVMELCKQANATCIINNRVDVALAVDAHGVHLGQDDMPVTDAREILGKDKLIGVTVHNVEEALLAVEQGADHISVSPIFHTDTKKDAGKPAGIKLIKEIKPKVKVPIVAIGGIKQSNMLEVLSAGADAVAIISGILNSENVEEKTKEIVGIINDTT